MNSNEEAAKTLRRAKIIVALDALELIGSESDDDEDAQMTEYCLSILTHHCARIIEIVEKRDQNKGGSKS